LTSTGEEKAQDEFLQNSFALEQHTNVKKRAADTLAVRHLIWNLKHDFTQKFNIPRIAVAVLRLASVVEQMDSGKPHGFPVDLLAPYQNGPSPPSPWDIIPLYA
jgi:hypothetical protein